jgi:uncharacterized protein (UPF0335 family)
MASTAPEQDQDVQATDNQLRLFFERIERLEEEKKGIADDVKDTFAEAKAMGYDAKIMRQVLRLRKMNPQERQEMEMLVDTYKAAIGLV